MGCGSLIGVNGKLGGLITDITSTCVVVQAEPVDEPAGNLPSPAKTPRVPLAAITQHNVVIADASQVEQKPVAIGKESPAAGGKDVPVDKNTTPAITAKVEPPVVSSGKVMPASAKTAPTAAPKKGSTLVPAARTVRPAKENKKPATGKTITSRVARASNKKVTTGAPKVMDKPAVAVKAPIATAVAKTPAAEAGKVGSRRCLNGQVA